MKSLIFATLWLAGSAWASDNGDYLVKMAPGIRASSLTVRMLVPQGSKVESLDVDSWYHVQVPADKVSTFSLQALRQNKSVEYVQPNYKIKLYEDYRAQARAAKGGGDDDGGFPFPFPDPGKGGGDGGGDGGFPFPFPDPGNGGGDGGGDGGFPFPFPDPGNGDGGGDGGFPFPFPDPGDGGGDGGGGFPFPDPGNGGGGGGNGGGAAPKDNPAIPTSGSGGSGLDPMFAKQWGMNQIGVANAWKSTKGSPDMLVAVIDTGVDYTHEDLVDNVWHNPGETGRDAQGKDKSTNGIDDDSNGYVDDVIGWDFVSNDNKPYDLAVSFNQIVSGGGNPGHGTHCAGNVGARGDNGKGIAGVAPGIKIMPLRFISEKGEGTSADAIKAIKYAVDNGAKVTSNSWGSEGEDANDPENQALRDVIKYAEAKGSLFIAAAGNGHQGRGYNNDTDSRPGYPASYDMDIIVSVAAIDVNGNLGSFSNWGRRTVDLAAPGVKVFSTMVGGKYGDSLGNFMGQELNWDGTSMATPHVAGAAALYWSANPGKSWQEVKQALLASVKKTNVLATKTTSGGQLDVDSLLKH